MTLHAVITFVESCRSTDQFSRAILTARTSAENLVQSTTLRPVFHLVRTKHLRQSERLHFISDFFIKRGTYGHGVI